MKLIGLMLILGLAVVCQSRVVRQEELNIPVTIIEDKEPQALPLVKEEKLEEQPEVLKKLEEKLEEQIKPEQIKTEDKPLEQEAPVQVQPLLKVLPDVDEAPVVPVEEPAADLGPLIEEQVDAAAQPHVRQVTQATPTQSSTQQNFVQQLIQNSPIGQFLNQLQGQPQQQQLIAADAPATPAPTIPGFLNPAAAITSAQQAVQNAAQSVVNSTTQAFQGIQQFASNLGNQFQNTLSGLTNPNQEPTTPRPPGPIQSFVNNVFGGGQNASAAPPQQQQGPLQGIINFLGGNRPQNAPAPIPTQAPVAPEKPAVDDKIDPANDEVAESDDQNEVRNSVEATDDSFEEAVPSNEVIVVNDDAGGDVAEPVELPQQQTVVVDAVAL